MGVEKIHYIDINTINFFFMILSHIFEISGLIDLHQTNLNIFSISKQIKC